MSEILVEFSQLYFVLFARTSSLLLCRSSSVRCLSPVPGVPHAVSSAVTLCLAGYSYDLGWSRLQLTPVIVNFNCNVSATLHPIVLHCSISLSDVTSLGSLQATETLQLNFAHSGAWNESTVEYWDHGLVFQRKLISPDSFKCA